MREGNDPMLEKFRLFHKKSPAKIITAELEIHIYSLSINVCKAGIRQTLFPESDNRLR